MREQRIGRFDQMDGVPLRRKPGYGVLSYGVAVAGDEQDRPGAVDQSGHPAQGLGFGAFDVHLYEGWIGQLDIVQRDDPHGLASGIYVPDRTIQVLAQKPGHRLCADGDRMNRHARFQMINGDMPNEIGGVGLKGMNVTGLREKRERIVARMRA